MHIHVLGSAAGGGFPQWNCNCRNCDGVRTGAIKARERTQSSIAVSCDGINWLLCNASPDILKQLRAFPQSQPARSVRDTGIGAVLLMDAQIDHTTGLYMLRENTRPLQVWCTEPVREDLLHGNPVLALLEHYCGTEQHTIPIDGTSFQINVIPGLSFTAIALQSNAPPYSPHRNQRVPGDNIGLIVESVETGKRLFYAPGVGQIEPHVWQAMLNCNVLMIDGTCWHADELITLGVSRKRAQDMGHLPQYGPGGMLEWLGRLPDSVRKILIHINNTNPILDEGGAERALLLAAGVEVAFDGMELTQ